MNEHALMEKNVLTLGQLEARDEKPRFLIWDSLKKIAASAAAAFFGGFFFFFFFY